MLFEMRYKAFSIVVDKFMNQIQDEYKKDQQSAKSQILPQPIVKNLSFSHSLCPGVLFEVEVPIWDPVKCYNLVNVHGKFGENICAGDKNKDSCTVTFHIP